MSLPGLLARLRALHRWLRRRDALESDMDEEFRLHIDLRAADLERAGLPAADARRRATIEFGGVDRFKEEARRVRGLPRLESLWRDTRFAARGFARAPGFATVAILTLGLGVGATTAISSVVHAALLRPPPFHQPGRLVDAWEADESEGWGPGPVSPADLLDWRERVEAFEDAAGWGTGIATVSGSGDGLAEAVPTGWVTGSFFDVLGVEAAVGRGFRPEETWDDAEPVVVLSDELWARRWGRDPRVVGTTVLVDEAPHRVVGVMPPGVGFPERATALWIPMGWSAEGPLQRWFREERFVHVVARLGAGATLQVARDQLAAVTGALATERPETNAGVTADLTPLVETLTREARGPLLLLFGATGLLLLLTCANLASLLVQRSRERGEEIGLRAALGASRGRLLQQLLVESLVLALVGGALGAILGAVGTRALTALQPPGAWRVSDVPLDAGFFGVALLLALGSGALFAGSPVLHALRAGAWRGRRSTTARGGRKVARALVVAEVAISVVLVAGAGLATRSFLALRRVDPGFEVADRMTASLVLPRRFSSDDDMLDFLDQAGRRLRAVPGVVDVAYSSRPPMGGASAWSFLAVEGRSERERGLVFTQRLLGPGYFRAAGVPLREGREFDSGDDGGSEPVVIVNRTLARRLFGEQSPVGRRITLQERPDERTWYRIVGVVGDEHQDGLRMPPQPELFQPYRRLPGTRVTFLVRQHPAGGVGGTAIREAIADVDPALAPHAVQSMEEVWGRALGPERLLLTLGSVFAALALGLAVLGVYGVAAEAAQSRTREIGVRMALGAAPWRIVVLVVGEGVALATVGAAVGLAGAWAAGRWMGAVLYGVEGNDGAALAGAALTLVLAALVACARPTLRAVRVDPALSTRVE